MAQVLADVFIQPARNVIVRTTPGREVKFFGGNAKIVDHRDMPHMLALPDARVIPTAHACSWAEQWLSNTREIKAIVEWPEGIQVEHTNKDEWKVIRPDTEASSSSGEPTPTPDAVLHRPFGGPDLINTLLGGEPAQPEPEPSKKPRRRK